MRTLPYCLLSHRDHLILWDLDSGYIKGRIKSSHKESLLSNTPARDRQSQIIHDKEHRGTKEKVKKKKIIFIVVKDKRQKQQKPSLFLLVGLNDFYELTLPMSVVVFRICVALCDCFRVSQRFSWWCRGTGARRRAQRSGGVWRERHRGRRRCRGIWTRRSSTPWTSTSSVETNRHGETLHLIWLVELE